MCFLLLFVVGLVICNSDDIKGWNYINLHCRDNDNAPVDWWIAYKPPSGDQSYWESGRNFSYISPDSSGKWQPSTEFITSNSMLQHTLSPLYRTTYKDHLAMLVYNSKQLSDLNLGSVGMGVMMADSMGGVWMGHTVPGLLDLTQDRLYFPDKEIHNGHMMICLSLNLETLNSIAKLLKIVELDILGMRVPKELKQWLPDWLSFELPDKNTNTAHRDQKKLDFSTIGRLLRVSMIIRRPGDTRCLYKTFAMNKRIILDVYGHGRSKNFCNEAYSVRNLEAISLKYAESIYYINNKTDRVSFAVSTAAHWQLLGDSEPQYWTCTSNLESEDLSAKGGLVLCIEDYHVWRSFDTLKVKEPKC